MSRRRAASVISSISEEGEGGKRGREGGKEEREGRGRREEEREGEGEEREGRRRGREKRGLFLVMKVFWVSVSFLPLSSLGACMPGGGILEVGTSCWAVGLGFISDHASLGLGGRGMWACSLPGAGVEENWGRGVVRDRVDWLQRSRREDHNQYRFVTRS